MRSWPLPATGWHNQIEIKSASGEELERWKERGREVFSATFKASSHLLVVAADFLGYYSCGLTFSHFHQGQQVTNFWDAQLPHCLILTWNLLVFFIFVAVVIGPGIPELTMLLRFSTLPCLVTQSPATILGMGGATAVPGMYSLGEHQGNCWQGVICPHCLAEFSHALGEDRAWLVVWLGTHLQLTSCLQDPKTARDFQDSQAT